MLTQASTPLAYSLSGWLGGWQAQEDNAAVHVLPWTPRCGDQLQRHRPVMLADRGNVTSLVYRQDSGLLPVRVAQLPFSL